jgi:PAS domain S-box-containing protein
MKDFIKSRTIKILFIEDEPIHYKLALNILLYEGLKIIPCHIEKKEDVEIQLSEFRPDLIITDFMMPDFSGMDVLTIAKNFDSHIPVIILTGAISEEVAVECMRMGASNYVLKNNLIRLPFSVIEALKKKEAILGEANALKNLKDSESRLHAIANAAGDGIIMLDGDGVISFWNPAAEKVFGYTHEEAVGQNLHTFIVPERYRGKYFDMFPAFQRTGTGNAVGKTLELSGLHKNGQELCISLTLTAVKVQEIWHAVGIVRDITKNKQVEKELISAKERAEASDKLKTAFINNISHEVRTPLNGILGFSDLITSDDNTPEDREQYKSLIKISSARLLNTITNYMDIALIMSGNMVVRPSFFALNELLQHLLQLYEPLCKVKNLDIHLHIPEGIDEVNLFSDREFHLKILSHLLDNAVKFTPSGSVSFGYVLKNNSIHYTISDTGIGVSKEMKELVFENFRQGEVSTTRDYEGSGLGLSISKGMVGLLGGSLLLTSEKGTGTSLEFSLNYSQMQLVQKTTGRIGSVTKNSGVVLLVEDDLTNFILQEKILKRAGFQVLSASNGKEAVEYCQRDHDISVVIMDLKMPVMDGFEATKLIKSNHPDLPVIAVTAFAMSGDEQRAFEAGCDRYLTKPLMEKDLLNILGAFGISPNPTK